jgi:hypothetical protein
VTTRTLLAAEDPKPFKFAKRTSGSIVVSSTSWTNLDTGMDLVLAAATGDCIEVSVNGFWNQEAGQNGFLDVATIVSGSPVNYFVTGTGSPSEGIPAWSAEPSRYTYIGAPWIYTLQAGDISSGTVTLRLRCQNPVGGTKTLFAISAIPFYFQAKNLGPMA